MDCRFDFKKFISKICNSTVLKQAGYIISSQVVSQISGFFIMLLLARFLTKSDYGLFRNITNQLALLSVIATGGLPAALTNKIACNKSNIIRYQTNSFALYMVFLASSMIIATLLTGKYKALTNCSLIGITIPMLYYGKLRGELLFTQYAIIDGLGSILKLLFILILLLFFSINITAVVVCYSFSVLLIVIINELFRIKNHLFTFASISKSTMNSILAYSIPSMLTSSSYMGIIYLPPLILHRLTGNENVAVYSLAHSLCLPFYLVPSVIKKILMPHIAKTKSIETGIHRMYLSLLIMVTLGVCYILLIIILGKPILNFISNEYLTAYTLLPIITFGFLFDGIMSCFCAFWEAQNKPKVSMTCCFVSLLTMLFTSAILIRRLGVIGAGISFMSGFFLGALVSIVLFLIWKYKYQKIY